MQALTRQPVRWRVPVGIALGVGALSLYVAFHGTADATPGSPLAGGPPASRPSSRANPSAPASRSAPRASPPSEPLVTTGSAAERSGAASSTVPNSTSRGEERSPLEEARAAELRELQRALPENMHVPYQRSAEELQLQREELEEQQRLFAAIEGGRTTRAELERAYELQARRYEDELELAAHCEKTVAGLEQGALAAHPFCASVASRSSGTKEANLAALAALRQELLETTGAPR